MRLGVIGVGNMGEALVRGVVRAGAFAADSVVVCDARAEAATALGVALGVHVAAGIAEAARADTIILAVKPQQIAEVLAALGAVVAPPQRVLSIAAGVSLAVLEGAFRVPVAVIRAMPNTPCLVGQGASAYALGTHASPADGAIARRILEAVGIAVEVGEAQMDAVTALSGSGPAYVFRLLEALVAGGEQVGLSGEVARVLATQTLLGAARLAAESGVAPVELRRRVTSPGGTTAAALAVLEEAGWAETLGRAIEAARDRGRALGELAGGDAGGAVNERGR